MTFQRRLFLFGIGFGIGCVAVYLMLIKDRVFPDWTPKGRVKESILTRPVGLGQDIAITDTIGLRERVLEAKVNFSKSDVRSGPCKSYVLSDDEGNMIFDVCDTIVTLRSMNR